MGNRMTADCTPIPGNACTADGCAPCARKEDDTSANCQPLYRESSTITVESQSLCREWSVVSVEGTWKEGEKAFMDGRHQVRMGGEEAFTTKARLLPPPRAPISSRISACPERALETESEALGGKPKSPKVCFGECAGREASVESDVDSLTDMGASKVASQFQRIYAIIHTEAVADVPAADSEAPPPMLPLSSALEIPNGVDLAEGVELLSPELVQGLVKDGTCVLIDVRSQDRVAGLIEGSVHVPCLQFAVKMPELIKRYEKTRLVVLFCQFCKHRAPFCANLFRKETSNAGNTMQRVAVMEGGFREWQQLGLPVRNEGNRSVQISADKYALLQAGLVNAM